MSRIARALGVDRKSVTARLAERGPQQRDGNPELLKAIGAVVREKPTFGYRRVTARLRREGRCVNHKRAFQLMQRSGLLLPRFAPREGLSDYGPPYVAHETRRLGRECGLLVRNTPAYSPESNGMAEASVKTFRRDFVYLADVSDAATVMSQLSGWFHEYNENHPHKGLKMLSPREFRRAHSASQNCPV